MFNATQDRTMPGTRLLLRISVLLPIASVFLLGLTSHWRDAAMADGQVVWLVLVALAPALVVYLPWIEHKLGEFFLPLALSIYLVCQSLLSSLLHNWAMVRFDIVQFGPFHVLEPGVLLLIPPLLIAWQYGWIGALLAAAATGTIHLAMGLALHRWMSDMAQLSPVTPILRPDLLYFLPLLVAYLGILLRRQQRSEAETRSQWREYAATAEVLAVEGERQRVAASLQASLMQPLSALNDHLEGLAGALGALPESAAERLRKARQHSRKAIYTADEMIEELQAAPLHDMGLVDAIRTRADMVSERHGIEVDVQSVDLPKGMTAQQEIVLYHVADQALNHVANHAGVQRIHLQLAVIDHFVALTVHDDGQCQCQGRNQGHSDLASLETSTKLIGGHFCFSTQQDGGNTLAVWLPCGRS
jgi:signal transduction histidine kinase